MAVKTFPVRCSVKNEDVVEAAPASDAPTTSEWSTILLPTKLSYIKGLTVDVIRNHKCPHEPHCHKGLCSVPGKM